MYPQQVYAEGDCEWEKLLSLWVDTGNHNEKNQRNLDEKVLGRAQEQGCG